jgi:prophage regulatory protein
MPQTHEFRSGFRILRLPEVLAVTGLARSTFWRRVKGGFFVRPVAIGPRAVGWPASEVEALNAARIAGWSEDQIRALVSRLEAARRTAMARVNAEEKSEEIAEEGNARASSRRGENERYAPQGKKPLLAAPCSSEVEAT